jgi:threonine synthase
MTDIEYDLAHVRLLDSTDPYVRFRDLLPVADPALLAGARYTPTVHARALGAHVGLQSLYLKNETVLPTGTTKDRMAAVALAFLWERGVREFCTSSTGNSSSAYAHAVGAYPGMHLYLFTAEGFERRVHFADNDQVTHFILRDASFVEAFAFAGTFAARCQLVSERGFFNPGRREGLKLAFLEAAEQVPGPIDWYVQAISSAMGVYGAYKGAQELYALGRIDRLPRLLCVQQESCAPMVRAFLDRSDVVHPEHIVPCPHGIAEAILRGDPTKAYPHVRRIVEHSNGTMRAVGESGIREARRLLRDLEGIDVCFSAATAVAGLIRAVREGTLPANDTVLVNLTGRDRTGDANLSASHWLARQGDEWSPAGPEAAAVRAWWRGGASRN